MQAYCKYQTFICIRKQAYSILYNMCLHKPDNCLLQLIHLQLNSGTTWLAYRWTKARFAYTSMCNATFKEHMKISDIGELVQGFPLASVPIFSKVYTGLQADFKTFTTYCKVARYLSATLNQ